MNINRYNYEEYFLLYTDNELNAAERLAVEEFVQENPDMERELFLLTQTTFKQDDNIIFPHKKLLLQSDPHENFIHTGNCEQLFILYADDELPNNEKASVEQFVYDNPQYQESFELMLSIKLTPDTSLTFPNKKSLYRHEKDTKPVVLTWGRMAAAAVILLLTGIVWLKNTPSLKLSDQVAEDVNTRASEKANTLQHKNTGKAADDTNTAIFQHRTDSVNAFSEGLVRAREIKESEKQEQKATNVKDVEINNIAQTKIRDNLTFQNRKPLVTKAVNEQHKPVNTQVGNIIKTEPENEVIASNKINQSELNSKTITGLPATQNDTNSKSDYTSEEVHPSAPNDENVIFANIAVDKKNSLRGLFRKASRLIDKTTSYRPAKRSGLAIGNIEIAFQ